MSTSPQRPSAPSGPGGPSAAPAPVPGPAAAPGASLNLLLSEVALAAARLAEAGVDSPRADAEELAGWIHGVSRGRLHSVPDRDFDARYWEAVARREKDRKSVV